MFEFMYAKKITKEDVMNVISKYKDEYHLVIEYKPDGTLEIFMGTRRKESEEKICFK